MIYGVTEARRVEGDIKRLGIQDVRLFYDEQLQMWSVCQVSGQVSSLILPQNYQHDARPLIMWWVKDALGRRRLPSDQDVNDVIAIAHRAEVVWDKGGDFLADKLDEHDRLRDEKHRRKQRDMVHSISKPMKNAIRKELA